MAGAIGNMENPSDAESSSISAMGSDVEFEGMPKGFIKYFREAKKLVDQIADEWSKVLKDTEASATKLGADKPGSGRLGLGSFSRAEKVGMGIGLAGFGAATYTSVAPNTMAAVTQRMGADTYAGLSGMSSRQAITQANRQIGGGATSAMGPTMAAMNLTYQGGYTANSLSSQNIMSQLGGMSAMSGMSNEMAAASVAGMNGMSFLRAGVQIRDPQGNLKPPNTIINDVYRFLYRGQKITKQQAALVLNPGSKGYATLQQITGGDQQLMQMIQSGIIARASAGSDSKFSSAMTSKDPNTMLDVLGVDKSSPIRSNFRFNSSENRKLESTEEGLVGGYNVSLRTTAALNDAYSVMADTLGPVNDGLMTLKGILQTLPNAGNMGGAIAGFTGALAGLASTIIQVALVSRLLGGAGVAGLFGKGAGLTAGLATAGTAAAVGLGAGVAGFGVGKGGKALGNKLGTSNTVTRTGSTLAGAGVGAAIGTMILPGVGTVVGSVLGGLGGFFGSGGPSDYSNFGIGGSSEPTSYPSPVPAKTPVTSPFGPRDNSKHPGISANHRGIDFGTPVGTPLTAIAPGVVSVIGNDPDGYGSWIEIKHEDGTAARYGHLSQTNVAKGQEVKPGQVVARSGGKPGSSGAGSSTGPHVHFEILNKKGVKIDPAPYLSGSPAGPIESATPAIPGPKAISSDSMWAAKKAATDAANLGKDASQLSSIGLSSSLTSSGFNEDLGGPATGGPMGGMNMGVASSSDSNSKNVVINLQMKVNIAQGSVQEADRLVKLVGKKLTDSDVLKKIGSAL
jgi:hypothetical protein